MKNRPSLTVLKGVHKNKKILIPKKIHGHNNVTTQKIKQAIFQIIENNVSDPAKAIFIDLFSGSGQMGIEAVSRGFFHTFFFDISKERVDAIRLWLRQNSPAEINTCSIDIRDGVREFFKFVSGNSSVNEFLMANKSIEQIIVFADPPYGVNSKNKLIIDYLAEFEALLREFSKNCSTVLIIQTSKDDLYLSSRDQSESEPSKAGKFSTVSGFYSYGRHRVIVI